MNGCPGFLSCCLSLRYRFKGIGHVTNEAEVLHAMRQASHQQADPSNTQATSAPSLLDSAGVLPSDCAATQMAVFIRLQGEVVPGDEQARLEKLTRSWECVLSGTPLPLGRVHISRVPTTETI